MPIPWGQAHRCAAARFVDHELHVHHHDVDLRLSVSARHLERKINQLSVNGDFAPGWHNGHLEEALKSAWQAVDWSFDISGVDSASLEFRNVPLRTLRLNPELQVIVRLDQARAGNWRHAHLEGTLFEFLYREMLRFERDEMLLQAPRSDPKAKPMQDAISRLRALGAAG